MRATAILAAILLTTTPAFAGGHGHGGGHGGHGHASHASKADRQAAGAERKAAAVTISPGTWHETQTYSSASTSPRGNPQEWGAVTMQPNGKFTAASPNDSPFSGKVNTKSGTVKAKGFGGLHLKGTYYDPLNGPDETDRATMAGDILGKHGVTLGTWFAGGPELTEP